jgi:hypothetical protein
MWCRIDSTTLINNYLCFALNYGLDDDSAIGGNFLFEENGYVRCYAEWHVQLGFLLYDYAHFYLVKQAPQIGDTWLTGGYDGYLQATVVDTANLLLPAGTFFSYEVEVRDTMTNELRDGYSNTQKLLLVK